MGEVWKANDPRLDRLVAIKARHTPFSDRFEREAQAIVAVNHPHVCSLYDVGPDYPVLEYVDRVLTHAVRLKIQGTTENVKVGVQELNVCGENHTLAREKGIIKSSS